jgi:hypothetical protein
MAEEKKPQEQAINEETGLPDNWVPVESVPIVPGANRGGAPPLPARRANPFSRALVAHHAKAYRL